MAKPFAWSYSALSGFETCPRQYHEMRILKRWPDPPGEAQQFGTLVHKYIEDYFKQGSPMPVFLKHLDPILDKLTNSKGEVQPEYKLALNPQFKPVEFFAKDAWVRAVGDVIKIHEDKSLQLDWKSGRYRDGDDQLKLQAAVSFATFPQLQKITVVYAWIKDKKTTVRQYERAQAKEIWLEFIPRVKRMALAKEKDEYPPKPNGLCARFCKVASCEFNGQRG